MMSCCLCDLVEFEEKREPFYKRFINPGAVITTGSIAVVPLIKLGLNREINKTQNQLDKTLDRRGKLWKGGNKVKVLNRYRDEIEGLPKGQKPKWRYKEGVSSRIDEKIKQLDTVVKSKTDKIKMLKNLPVKRLVSSVGVLGYGAYRLGKHLNNKRLKNEQ